MKNLTLSIALPDGDKREVKIFGAKEFDVQLWTDVVNALNEHGYLASLYELHETKVTLA